jgi:hypothetical protein
VLLRAVACLGLPARRLDSAASERFLGWRGGPIGRRFGTGGAAFLGSVAAGMGGFVTVFGGDFSLCG